MLQKRHFENKLEFRFFSGMELARLVTNRVEPNRLQCKFLNRCLQLSKVPDASLKLLHSATNIAMQCPTLVLRQRAIQFVKK